MLNGQLPIFSLYSRLMLALALTGVLSTALTFVQISSEICTSKLRRDVEYFNLLREQCNMTMVRARAAYI